MIVEPTENNIQVILRVRPLSEKETRSNKSSCIEVVGNGENKVVMGNKTGQGQNEYCYDWVACEKKSQTEIFEKLGIRMAEWCLEGYNSTILAYGQTGAGKTYTMRGKGVAIQQIDGNSLEGGIMPRVLQYLFQKLRGSGNSFSAKCSFIEIYNEQILDLLNTGQGCLQLREKDKKVSIEGVTEEGVGSWEETAKVMLQGDRNRHVASTSMNIESSRSHSVFSLVIEQRKCADGVNKVVTSIMNFVDLAGSERQKDTNTVGERLKEAGSINKSLSVLGAVINSLVEKSEGKKLHVRYRDSKLTFLLRDSLGGNSKTAIVANVSPSSANFQETLSTLKFAQRAKLIKNNASINEENPADIEALRKQVNALKQLLEKEKRERDMERQKIMNQSLSASQESELIKECNLKTHEIENLLKESIEILNLTEKKLQFEYSKKQEFTNLYQKAFAMYEQKEIHLRTMVNLLQDKNGRIAEKNWTPTEESSSLAQTLKLMEAELNQVPSIMQVFQENLNLKHQIVYANVDGKPNPNILRILDVLRRNLSFMEEVSHKISGNASMREKMIKRFEKLCLDRGMTCEDLARVSAQEENEELKISLHNLNVHMMEKTQLEHDLKYIIETEKSRREEQKAEFEKVKSDYETEINCLEKRIEELNLSYTTVMQQGSLASNEFEIREIELKDKIDALSVKVSESLKKLARSEERFVTERKLRDSVIADYEKKINILNLDLMRLQEEVSTRKASQNKLKEEISFAKSEIESLNTKLEKEIEEKVGLGLTLTQIELANKTLIKEKDCLISELEKSESLESDLVSASLENKSLKEDMDTLQQSLEYLKRDLELKNGELEKADETILAKDKEIKTLTADILAGINSIKELEEQLEKQVQSNSPHNIAIKENHSLRTMVRELRFAIEAEEKRKKSQEEEFEKLYLKFEGLSNSETHFKAAFRDVSFDNQTKSSQIKELKSFIVQINTEVVDLNKTLVSIQEELSNSKQFNKEMQESLEDKNRIIQELLDRIKFGDKKAHEMKDELNLRMDEIQKMTDKLNDNQMKYVNLQQHYENYRDNTERESSHLGSLVKSINEQNKFLIKEKQEKEDEIKKTKDELDGEIAKLSRELKEYKMTMSGLEINKNFDQQAMSNIREEVRESIRMDSLEYEKIQAENESLKSNLNEKKKTITNLITKKKQDIEFFETQIDTINANFLRLQKEYNNAGEAFKLKETERSKMKDETHLMQITVKALEDELSMVKFELEQTKRKTKELGSKCDSLKSTNQTLSSDYELLLSMNDEKPDNDPRSQKTVKRLKNEVDSLKRQLSHLQNKGKGSSSESEGLENSILSGLVSEDSRELVKSIIEISTQSFSVTDYKIDEKDGLVKYLTAVVKSLDQIKLQRLQLIEKENQFKINFIKYSTLEKEVLYLTQKFNISQNSSVYRPGMDSVVHKRPQYVARDPSPYKPRSFERSLTEQIKSLPLSSLDESSNLTLSSRKLNAASRTEYTDIGKRTDDKDFCYIVETSGANLSSKKAQKSSNKSLSNQKIVDPTNNQNMDPDTICYLGQSTAKRLKLI